ncbi:hypothetical protein BRAO285_1210023 [Bradyrhizobium sp. ORS 285]|nr:hypothetical protein BRAO285_1210023 [Bradyrhizobium sp. ORS 285]
MFAVAASAQSRTSCRDRSNLEMASSSRTTRSRPQRHRSIWIRASGEISIALASSALGQKQKLGLTRKATAPQSLTEVAITIRAREEVEVL